MDCVRRGLGYKFIREELFHKALNKASTEHSLWAKKGDVMLKDLITKLVQAAGKSDHIRQIVESNDLMGSIVIAIGLGKCIPVDPQLEKEVKRLVGYYNDLKSVHQFAKAFFIPCYRSAENLGTEAVFMPKTLGDVFEALAYAIYLDCGENRRVWEAVFEEVFNPIIDFLVNENVRQPVGLISEKTNGGFLKQLTMVQAGGVFRALDENQAEVGRGHSQDLAKRAAAITKLEKTYNYRWPWAIHM